MRIAAHKRPVDDTSNLVCCVRHGYSNITPNACIEKWTAKPDLCGSCPNASRSAARLSLVVPGGLSAVHRLARTKQLGTIADPHIQPVDLDHEGRPGAKKVNTYIVWINGLRAPHGDVNVRSKSMNTGWVEAIFSQSLLGDKKIRHIAVDQILGGRHNARFEFSAGADFKQPEAGIAVTVRLTAVDSDS